MTRRLPHGAREILQRLAAGETVTGPREVLAPALGIGTVRRRRRWTWPNGSNVHVHSVDALAARGLVEIHAIGAGVQRIVLKGEAPR